MSVNKRQSNFVVRSGIGLGSVLAVAISWTTNNSIIWAILHGICSWFYVIYFMFTSDGWSWF